MGSSGLGGLTLNTLLVLQRSYALLVLVSKPCTVVSLFEHWR